jgi:hypothetical protein
LDEVVDDAGRMAKRIFYKFSNQCIHMRNDFRF